MDRPPRDRSRSRSPPPWRRQPENHRFNRDRNGPSATPSSGRGRGHGNFQNQYQRRNQEQEDRQMRDWMSQEDDFVLKQSKKKAKIRIKESRAKLIDKFVWLLSIVDPTKDLLDDELDELELEIGDPFAIVEMSPLAELQELENEVDHYLVLEHNEVNRAFWEAMKSVCKGRRHQLIAHGPSRGIGSVSTDVDRLLESKTIEQLRTLESQVHQKLRSDEAIDEEYWEQMLESIVTYKAKAHLKEFFTTVRNIQLNHYREQQILAAKQKISSINGTGNTTAFEQTDNYEHTPQLKLRPEDQAYEVIAESEFHEPRTIVFNTGYISTSGHQSQVTTSSKLKPLSSASVATEDRLSVTNVMYNREAAKGIGEDEEIFAGEAEVAVESKPLWLGKYHPRKPKHFNRVQMGYEWNKYNQTHYDHDNPPPKVVQGYKFNVFYPDLIDTTKAPTYRIERENGRRKGQSLAPAGEEDTCLIRFVSGPPYEDIAFRIVDREWDYSAKRERGFKSTFDNGILQLHFQFKKIYYRK